jgi:hypothetical protein
MQKARGLLAPAEEQLLRSLRSYFLQCDLTIDAWVRSLTWHRTVMIGDK